MRMAAELGGTIGRSQRPTCFILGAGCSISSGAPSTRDVHQALLDATSVRFEGLELRDVLHRLPEAEKQDILSPLFATVRPASGYMALAALARHRPLTVLNLNWDTALIQACQRLGVPYKFCDVKELTELASEAFIAFEAGLVDIHMHGIIGQECRYGRLETLVFDDDQASWLLAHGFAYTTVIIGASLVDETDFTILFDRWTRHGAGRSPTVSQWFFMRAATEEDARDRLRRSNVQAQPFTYIRDPDIDFDKVATLITDRAIGVLLNASRSSGR
jgi:hypothetical protein